MGRPPGRRCAVRSGNKGCSDALRSRLQTPKIGVTQTFSAPLTVASCKQGRIVLIVPCTGAPGKGHGNRSGLGLPHLVDRVCSAVMQTEGCKGRGPVRMKRGCLRVVPVGTDVMGVSVLPRGVV